MHHTRAKIYYITRTCPLRRVTWSTPDLHHTHATQLMATASNSLVLKACQMQITGLSYGKAMLGPRRDVSEAIGCCKGCCLMYLTWMKIIQSNAHSNWSKNAHSHASRTHSNAKTNTRDCQCKKVNDSRGAVWPNEATLKRLQFVWFPATKTSTIVCGAA